jgi:shikimate dehydrogenase
MKLYGIIGYPLAHSFSQKYFTEKFQKEGITDCIYKTYPIQSIDEISELIKQNPDLHGLNITIPYKQQILHHLNTTKNIPDGLTACNCIRIADGKTSGYNTDIIGFERSLLPQLKDYHNSALILGNGGAAEAVKFVLQKLNIAYKIVSRKIHDSAELTYAELNETIVKENLLIINTTPLGTFPDIDECPNLPYRFLTPRHLLYDLIYNPEKTFFLQKGQEQGATIKNGYEMLVIQAEESWKIWSEA